MDTGLGKTITAISYLHHRLTRTPTGDATRAILWVTPKHTVGGLIEQLAKERKVPVFQVPKPKRGTFLPKMPFIYLHILVVELFMRSSCLRFNGYPFTHPFYIRNTTSIHAGAGGKVTLKDYHINVVDSDFLREMILLELPALAPSLAVVFDEVDTCYDATLRTSACRRLAMLAPVFVAQTATPMVKNVEHLVSWLANTEQYPVTKANFLVAASGMVSTQISLGIAAVDELDRVPLTPIIRAVRCAFFDRDLHSIMLLVPTPARLKRVCV
jgi:hypothetical protein